MNTQMYNTVVQSKEPYNTLCSEENVFVGATGHVLGFSFDRDSQFRLIEILQLKKSTGRTKIIIEPLQ